MDTNKTVEILNLGLIPYRDAWNFQENLLGEKVSEKSIRRIESDLPFSNHQLILCEHPSTFTLGKSGNPSNLLVDERFLSDHQVDYIKINRGGDITHHGPGQCVGYPILDLECFFTDIHRYLRLLEETIILTLRDFGIESGRYPGYTGVWLEPEHPQRARKICAMGIRCSRWITMHGWALNVNNDLTPFGWMVPCGIRDKDVTSLSRELEQKVDMNLVHARILTHFSAMFGATLLAKESPFSHPLR
jgi:lipoyl(octanoyl) transferase